MLKEQGFFLISRSSYLRSRVRNIGKLQMFCSHSVVKRTTLSRIVAMVDYIVKKLTFSSSFFKLFFKLETFLYTCNAV